MKVSPSTKVCDLYEDSADSYAKMMEAEIELPMYTDTLERLAGRLGDISGALVDTSCGSGHMLQKYREKFDGHRRLIGVDLSPRMVELSRSRLGSGVDLITGDMGELASIQSDSAAAVLSYFSIHHLDAERVKSSLTEWNRILTVGGQLVIAAWEGTGSIDYGDTSDVVALRYSNEEIVKWIHDSGFQITKNVVESVPDLEMDAAFVEAAKA